MRQCSERALHPLREHDRRHIGARTEQLIRNDELQRMTPDEQEAIAGHELLALHESLDGARSHYAWQRPAWKRQRTLVASRGDEHRLRVQEVAARRSLYPQRVAGAVLAGAIRRRSQDAEHR